MDLQTPADREAERQQSLDDLLRARTLDREARTAARWYVRYLNLFALASFVMAVAFGVIGPLLGAAVITPVWLIIVTALSVWTQKQKAEVRGLTRSHLWTIAGWAVAWAVTIVLGSNFFPDALWWWVLGGLLMATPPLLAAHYIGKQTKA